MELKVFQRLIEERMRLGLNKTEMAALCGVAQPTYLRYEAGERSLDAEALAHAAKGGADVLYILTGQRSQAVAEVDLLPPRQRALLNHYEALSDEGKRNVEGTVSLLAKQTGKKKSA